MMLSQIQPHFIYNSLSSISVLIDIDPEKARDALDNFTEYLRHNLSSLTETKLIPLTMN
jgi:sensor histidine kinase YesM